MRPSNLGGQLTLFGRPRPDEIVNVASVPQRSPFRYPGGKTWLVPRIRQWLATLRWTPAIFVEPFAGGAIVGLTVAFERLAHSVLLVELDDQVAAVWKTILSDDNEWLVSRILSFELTEANLRAELAKRATSTRQKAFATILKNRTFHGGILAPGSSPMNAGENDKGLASRWYPATLARRIRAIAKVRDRLTFIEGDGIAALEEYAQHPRAAFSLDPPYTAGGKRAGTRLYRHHTLDHAKLFATAARLAGPFLMTYDDTDEPVQLARKYGFAIREIPMTGTHLARRMELLVSRDLSWLR